MSSAAVPWHSWPVFVYGTLKTEQPNHVILQTAVDESRAKFLGRATTVECWPLVVYSQFNIPFLLDCRGTGKASILFLHSAFSVRDQCIGPIHSWPVSKGSPSSVCISCILYLVSVVCFVFTSAMQFDCVYSFVHPTPTNDNKILPIARHFQDRCISLSLSLSVLVAIFQVDLG